MLGKRCHGGQYRHAVKVMGVLYLSKNGRNEMLPGPFWAKLLGHPLKRASGGFANRGDLIFKAFHALRTKFVLEKIRSELSCKEGNAFDDSKADAPVLVLGKLLNGREETLGKKVDTNYLIDLIQLGDDVETNVGEGVLKEGEKNGDKVIDRGGLAELRSQFHRYTG
mmetsp:Transcript_15676/g.28051  ORF Transcript_15676/g.28051 Transcript_15676/m.28051 type:complete len:167 (-) Transcript_15676:1245-1745(-)